MPVGHTILIPIWDRVFLFLKKMLFIYSSFLAALGLFAAPGLSLVAASRGRAGAALYLVWFPVAGALLLQSPGSRACGRQCLCPGTSAVRSLWLRSTVSVIVTHGLSCPRNVESSQSRDWTCVPCNGRQTLNHWITREVQGQGHF